METRIGVIKEVRLWLMCHEDYINCSMRGRMGLAEDVAVTSQTGGNWGHRSVIQKPPSGESSRKLGRGIAT